MNTVDTVFFIILSVVMSLFFILLIALVVVALKLVKSVKNVIAKAEHVIDNVESATDVIRDARGPFPLMKLIRNIMDLTNKRR